MKTQLLSTIALCGLLMGCPSNQNEPAPGPRTSPYAISVDGKLTLENVVVRTNVDGGKETPLESGAKLKFFCLTKDNKQIVLDEVSYLNNKATVDLGPHVGKLVYELTIKELIDQAFPGCEISDPNVELVNILISASQNDSYAGAVTLKNKTGLSDSFPIIYTSGYTKVSGSKSIGNSTIIIDAEIFPGFNNIAIAMSQADGISTTKLTANDLPTTGLLWESYATAQ